MDRTDRLWTLPQAHAQARDTNLVRKCGFLDGERHSDVLGQKDRERGWGIEWSGTIQGIEKQIVQRSIAATLRDPSRCKPPRGRDPYLEFHGVDLDEAAALLQQGVNLAKVDL